MRFPGLRAALCLPPSSCWYDPHPAGPAISPSLQSVLHPVSMQLRGLGLPGAQRLQTPVSQGPGLQSRPWFPGKADLVGVPGSWLRAGEPLRRHPHRAVLTALSGEPRQGCEGWRDLCVLPVGAHETEVDMSDGVVPIQGHLLHFPPGSLLMSLGRQQVPLLGTWETWLQGAGHCPPQRTRLSFQVQGLC